MKIQEELARIFRIGSTGDFSEKRKEEPALTQRDKKKKSSRALARVFRANARHHSKKKKSTSLPKLNQYILKEFTMHWKGDHAFYSLILENPKMHYILNAGSATEPSIATTWEINDVIIVKHLLNNRVQLHNLSKYEIFTTYIKEKSLKYPIKSKINI